MTYTYIRQIPGPPLDAYIDFLEYQDGLIYPHEMKPPVTSQALVVNFGGAIEVLMPYAPDRLRREPKAPLLVR